MEGLTATISSQVDTAVKASQEVLLAHMDTLISSKLNRFETQISQSQKEISEAQYSKIQNDILWCSDTYKFTKKHCEEQFKFNNKVVSKLREAQEFNHSRDSDSTHMKIEEGMALLNHRQKLVKLADSSEAGWKAVEEYMANPIVSDSDDEKRMDRARSRANRRFKQSVMKGKPRRGFYSRRFHPYSVAPINPLEPQRFSQRQHTDSAPSQSVKPGTCFACGNLGHWRRECPGLQGRQAAMARASEKVSKSLNVIVEAHDEKVSVGERPVGEGKSAHSIFPDTRAQSKQTHVVAERTVSPIGRLKGQYYKWEQAGACDAVLDIIAHGYRIPFREQPSPEDTGMYYCARATNQKKRWKLSDYNLRAFLNQRGDYLLLFFHIDVSTTDKSFPLPAPVVRDTHAYLEISTYWGDWGTCSVCGMEGERWRTGLCWTRLFNGKAVRRVDPIYVFYTLRSAQAGMPCAASLFKHYSRFKTPRRPDEKMAEQCNVPCVNNTRTDVMTTDLQKLRYKSLAKVQQKHINVTEGQSVALKCPRASLDTMVYWVNGTKYLTSLQLRNITNRRAEIDVYGVMRFHRTVVADTGFYSCWHTKKRQIVYALTVLPADNSGDWLYHIRFVCLSFVFDTFVFLALLAVKHKHRHVRQPGQSHQTADDDEDGDNEPCNENCNNYYDDTWEDDWNDYNEGHIS